MSEHTAGSLNVCAVLYEMCCVCVSELVWGYVGDIRIYFLPLLVELSVVGVIRLVCLHTV